jgi:hypothetical protein
VLETEQFLRTAEKSHRISFLAAMAAYMVFAMTTAWRIAANSDRYEWVPAPQ